jgi:hypothetical protein
MGKIWPALEAQKYKNFLEFDLLGSSTTLRFSERLFSNSLTLDETIACVAVRWRRLIMASMLMKSKELRFLD